MPRPYRVVVILICGSRKAARAVNDRPYKPPAKIIGGAVRRERVGGASKNVS